jgi:Protein of unknown function (DUF2950)
LDPERALAIRRLTPVSSRRRGSAISYQASPSLLCTTVDRRYHCLRRTQKRAILLPSVLRPFRFPCGLQLAALAVTTALLAVATGALAQERYRTPDEAVAALVDAVRSDALQQVMRVLGPGSDEIVQSGDPVDDAAMRRRFLDAFGAKHEIIPDGEDQAVLIVGEERFPFPSGWCA